MTDLVLSQGVRVINGVEMMSTKGIMSICEKIGEPKRHADIIRDVRNMLKSLDAVLRLNITDSYEEEKQTLLSGEKETVQFWLNKKLCDTLISGYSIPIRYAIIEEFDKLSNKKKTAELEKRNLPSYQIEDPIERAKVWIEEKQQHILELDEKDRAIYKLKNEKSDKEMLADAYLEHDTCKSLTTFAKEIYPQTNLGVRSIFKILRERGHWLKTTNLPSSHMVKTGKFIIKEVQCADKMVRTHGYITPKGEAWLLKGLLSYVRDEATARAVISFE